MDNLILKFVLFFAKVFLKKDVDFEKLKIIVQTKLLMDRRRVRVSMKQRTQKEPKNQLLITQIVYALFGLVIGSVLFSVKEIVPGMVLLHAYILFMMAMTLITDFSAVLLDTTDNQIILPRPVNSKTFFISRLVHILVYLLQFTIALSLFPVIFTFFLFGPLVGVCSIITILLTVAFAVFLTYLLYGLILRVSSEEKVKDIISRFQIVLTVFFAVGYQVIPRLINFDDLKIVMELHWYSYLIPPVWMAFALQSIHELHADVPHIIMIVLAIAVPGVTFWIMIKFLAPSFARKIAAMGNSSGENKTADKGSLPHKKTLPDKLSAILCTNKTEQAGFNLTGIITSRDKGFKMQFYPSLAYLVVFAFVFVFKSGKDIATIWTTLGSTKLFLWFVYLAIFTISSAITLIAFNENFAASWVYLACPLHRPGSLISGALKLLLTKFFMPVFIILFSFALYIWGYKIIDDFILGFFNNILIFLLLSHIGKSYLPFSMQPSVKQQSGKFIQVILQLFIVAVLVGLHYLALQLTWLVAILIPFSAAGCYFLFRVIQNYSWQKISS